ncbi:MAG: thioredoxin family protein [Firmicutes bacterium]|nr:thioredoxin family protein [Bacillota bacterium]
MPIVVIDGKVFSKGSFSLKAIIQELLRLSN